MTAPPPRLLGAVLTGGKGRRFGGGKAGAEVAGVPMARRVLRALASGTAVSGFVTGARDPLPDDVPARRDRAEGRGPLEGLAVALDWAREEGCEGAVLLACDLPLMDPETVGWLVRGYRDRAPRSVHGLVPVVEGRLQPLAAVYSVRALPVIEARLRAADRSLHAALRELEVRRVAVGEGTPPAWRFLNVNTLEDHARAAALLREGAEAGGAEAGDPLPVVCVVGWKDTGKTTLTVALVSELVRRGRRVMTAKHGHGFQLDAPGTDSWRHRHEAGAGRVALVGPDVMAVTGDWGEGGEPPLREVVRRYLADAELVVAEGWKGGPEPKIEVHREATGRDPILSGRPANAATWLVVVTDASPSALPVPVLPLEPGSPASLEEVARSLADLVEERLLPGS